MKNIKILKTGNIVRQNIVDKYTDEEGNEIWNIPKDLDSFKLQAIDTLNWQIGITIKNIAGGKIIDLSTANSKAIALLAKKIDNIDNNTDMFTDLEKDSYNALVTLANGGYSDSDKLKATLEGVLSGIGGLQQAVGDIQNCDSYDCVIDVLNRL
jgi:hypothetical protein